MDIWAISAVILAIVVASKLLAKKTSSVDVLWLIFLGAIAANIGIIPVHNEILEMIGEWGIVFIMFALGFDEDLSHFKEGLIRSWGIAIIGALFPFLVGYTIAISFGYPANSAMLWGLTMTATAVSLTMMTLKAENLHKSTASTGIMTAAVIDDILSLIGVAIIVPLVLATTGSENIAFGAWDIVVIIGKVIVFFMLVIIFGLFAFPEKVPQNLPVNPTALQRADFYLTKVFTFMNIKDLLLAYKGEFTPLIMVFIAMALGAIAHYFGFHPAIGAYMAGLFLHADYFAFAEDRRKDNHYKQSRNVIDHIAFTIFGPIFFVNLGAKLIFDMDILWETLPMFLSLFVFIFIFQVTSAALAAKYTGHYKWHESVMIGFGMLGRAELAFIVIDIAYTTSHIITDSEFYVLIFTIFLLNLSVPLSIKWWKPYYLGKKELTIKGIKLSK